MKTNLSVLFAAVITALLVAGCGGGGTNEQESANGADAPAATPSTESESTTGPAATEADAEATAEAREIVIEANDQMQFSVDNFDVEPGEQIRLVLKNVGTMPKFSMGHNVVILTQDADPAAFADSAMSAATNEYIPEGSEDQIVAHTKLLGGGEEDSITFTAPEETGDYPFLCSFPGHFQIGMSGTMTVQ